MSEPINNLQALKVPSIEPLLIDIESLIADPKILKLYGNSFVIGNSLSDASIVIQQGRTSIAVLTVSLTTLKSLHTALQQAIHTIEKGLGTPLLDAASLRVVWEKNLEQRPENQL
jgi:hypothetical protein